LDLIEHVRRALGLRGLARRHGFEMLDSEQRVLVGGEAMVDVVLYETRERAELRQVRAEETELVHLGERQRDAAPAATDVEEEIAHGRRAPEVVVDEVERVFHRALEVGRELAAEAVQVP